jgi:hypothetical protein
VGHEILPNGEPALDTKHQDDSGATSGAARIESISNPLLDAMQGNMLPGATTGARLRLSLFQYARHNHGRILALKIMIKPHQGIDPPRMMSLQLLHGNGKPGHIMVFLSQKLILRVLSDMPLLLPQVNLEQ